MNISGYIERGSYQFKAIFSHDIELDEPAGKTPSQRGDYVY